MTDRPRSSAAAAAAIRRRYPDAITAGLVLGSGLGGLAEAIESPQVMSFDEVPHHPRPTVEGHAGEIVLGRLNGVSVGVWRGRAHFYEGHSMSEVGFAVRLMRELGASAALLTNAAGGLNPEFAVGDLMLVTDHINLPSLAGHNPLRGPNLSGWGERFVDMSDAYDLDLRAVATAAAERTGIRLRQGVYAMVAGPSYETPAEARLLRQLGADAVGMSTAPEVIVARQAGLRVLAISLITNALLAASSSGPAHADVLAVAQSSQPRLNVLIRGILSGMARIAPR